MIRYPVTLAQLEENIEKEAPGWLAKASEKTAHFRAARTFDEPEKQNSWGDIKAVFMRLQRFKCAYCERVVGEGKIEHDVEHFRPKSEVKAWPTAKQKNQKNKKFSYDFETGSAESTGYYLLAYNIRNYATACKYCNTSLKSSYFPVEAKRQLTSDNFTTLKKEKPLLIYPIGSIDDDPQTLITFEGITPVPVIKTGAQYRRARVLIDFFSLDERDTLRRQRAKIIQAIWLAFRTLQNNTAPPEDQADAKQIIELALSPQSEHTSCAQAFHRLCQTDIQRARTYKEEAQKIAPLV